MSLIVAYHRGENDYGMVSDTLLFHGDASAGEVGRKAFDIGRWVVGGVGSLAPFRWMVVELARTVPVGGTTRGQIEAWLDGAWAAVQPRTGSTEVGRLPSVGCEVLAVGPNGIVRIDYVGSVTWIEAPMAFAGCAAEFASGYAVATRAWVPDHGGLKLATQIVQAAGRAFPAVAGGEAHVFDSSTMTRLSLVAK